MAKAKAAAKKPNIFVRMGKRLRETFSELRRVTWPSFPKVVKNVVVVLVLVLVFLVAVTVVNYVLQGLLNLISGVGWSGNL
ncbi:MAG: preprotein translocase subunit SecE [Clostridia bacterium]|nr:preprotein translocase subunit SecE [Clostridia bacterium]